MKPIIIIGTGLAGYNLAREIRKHDTEVPLHLITTKDGQYYSKPQLSNALTQKKTFENLSMLNADTMREQLNATISTRTRVQKINPKQREIVLDNGSKLSYSKLVLAWGAHVVDSKLNGSGLDRVFTINDLDDYQRFRTALEEKKQVAILGAGLIGCEFANDLLNVGVKVEVISLAKRPLDTLLHETASLAVAEALKKKGLDWHWESSVESVESTKNDQIQVQLSNGKNVLCDLMISAIGLQPITNVAEAAGIKINKGIVVDQYLQTSNEDIFAIGDCAEVCGQVHQYILPINHAAKALAETLCGKRTKVHYPAMPISIKTPACPVIVVPPPRDCEGRWQIEHVGHHVRAMFHDSTKQLQGFALTGDRVRERLQLINLVPPTLPNEDA